MACPLALTFATLKLFLKLFLLLVIWYLCVHIHVHREVIKRVIQTYWIKGFHVKIKCLTTIIMFSKKNTPLLFYSLQNMLEKSFILFLEKDMELQTVKAESIGACSEPL